MVSDIGEVCTFSLRSVTSLTKYMNFYWVNLVSILEVDMLTFEEIFSVETVEENTGLEELATGLAQLSWPDLIEVMQMLCSSGGYELEYGEVEAESFALFKS